MFFDKHRFDEMFHVKQFCMMILFFSIILFYKNVNVYAAINYNQYNLDLDNALNNYNYVVTINNKLNDDIENIILIYSNYQFQIINGGTDYSFYITIDNSTNILQYYYYIDGSISSWSSGNIILYQNDIYNYGIKNSYVKVEKGTIINNSNFNNFISGEVKWYENIWNIFKGGFQIGTTWIKTQIDNIGTIVSNWWDDITHGSHGGEHSFGNKYLTLNQATPTPIPTITPRPTPIPYSTVLQDDGNGNTTILYQYNNPQGTPTASPYNPNQYTYYNTDINITGGDRNNPIYVQDVGNVNFSDLIDIANNSIEVNIGDLDSSTDMFTVPLEETAENVGEAVSGFSALPDDLFIIIGCIACIPLIAGIIGRLLK